MHAWESHGQSKTLEKEPIAVKLLTSEKSRAPQHMDDKPRTSSTVRNEKPMCDDSLQVRMKRKVSDDPEETPWVEQLPGKGDDPA